MLWMLGRRLRFADHRRDLNRDRDEWRLLGSGGRSTSSWICDNTLSECKQNECEPGTDCSVGTRTYL